MKNYLKVVAGLALIGLGSCGDPVAPVPPNETLTATQATNLLAKAQSMSTLTSDLAWLTDSLEVILKAGTIAYNVPVTVDGQVKRYYAVSLMKQIIGDTTATSWLHFIAFDDVTNPTDFILVTAFAEIPGDVPIGDILAVVGPPTMFAHKVKFNGAVMTDYVGKTGTVNYSVTYGNAGCGTASGITCRIAYLDSDFTITQARPDAALSDVHTFSVSGLTIPGAWLLFN